MSGWVQSPSALNPYVTNPVMSPTAPANGLPTLNASLASVSNPNCSQANGATTQPMVCVPLSTWQALQGVRPTNTGYTTPLSVNNSNTMSGVPIAKSVATAPPVISPMLTKAGGSPAAYSPLVPQTSIGTANPLPQPLNAASYSTNQPIIGASSSTQTMPLLTADNVPAAYPVQPQAATSAPASFPTYAAPINTGAPNVNATSVNPRGVVVPVGGDPFTHPIPDILSPDKMAPWAYYNPSRNAQPVPAQPLTSQAAQPPSQEAPVATPAATTPPVIEEPPVTPQPSQAPPTNPAAANPLQGDGAKGASGSNPNLPAVGDAFPLTRELVEKWKADLDDRHPVTSRRTQAANEIATFLLQHPETTLEGQPRQLLERFVNNILSTGRTGSDTNSNTVVERDMILIALKQGGFYNLPESTLKHIEHLAQHSTALHGMEQTVAQEVLAKHRAGDFTPTKEFVTTYEGRFPWVITTREQAKEPPPHTKEDAPPGQTAKESLYQAPNTVVVPVENASLNTQSQATTENQKRPWYKRMFSKTPPKELAPQTIDPVQLNPAANHMGGQRLNLISQ